MPKSSSKPLYEKRGCRKIICEFTGLEWLAWKKWCSRHGQNQYSGHTLKLWLQQNLWKVLPPPGDSSGGACRDRRRDS